MLADAPVEDGGEQRAALADESKTASGNHGLSEVGIEATDRVHDAEAVGADEAHFALDGGGDLALEGFAGFTDFLKAGRDDDG